MESRQKNILTILLIIIIVIIAGIIGYLGFEVINQNVKEKEASEITSEFDSIVPTITEDELMEEGIEGQNGDIENSGNENLLRAFVTVLPRSFSSTRKNISSLSPE